MGLPKGRTNNPAGRPKKSLTKITLNLREDIVKFLSSNFGTVVKEFEKIDSPTQKIKLYLDLMGFALPRLKSSESVGLFGNLTTEEIQEVTNQLKEYYNEAARQDRKG